MSGKSQLVTKGTILVVMILFVGTAWADGVKGHDFNLQQTDVALSYASTTRGFRLPPPPSYDMEEVVVSGKRIAAPPNDAGGRFAIRFKFESRLFSQRNAANTADHSELPNFANRSDRTGYVELFKIRFGRG